MKKLSDTQSFVGQEMLDRGSLISMFSVMLNLGSSNGSNWSK